MSKAEKLNHASGKGEGQNNVFVFPEKQRYKPETAESYIASDNAAYVPDWAGDASAQALARLKEAGLPTPRLERWKYTNLPSVLKKMRLEHAESGISCSDGEGMVKELAEADAQEQVLLTERVLGADKYHDDMLADHVLTHARDGVIITVPEGKSVDKPVEISLSGRDGHLTTPVALIRVKSGAELTVFEKHDGNGAYWKNMLTRIVLEEGAKLHHVRMQTDSTDAAYTQFTEVRIAEKAQYNAFTLTQGGRLSRNQIHAVIQGSGADCTLNGINLLSDQQLGDTTITIEHQAPGCTSNQFYRTLLDEKAHGVFQGKVHVHQEAQQTDGYQLSNAIMLGDRAEMYTKPELEIYADDVQCSHGATTGQLEEEPLFYMRSRGLSEQDAKRLLMSSFLAEVTEQIENASIREQMETFVEAWLSEHTK